MSAARWRRAALGLTLSMSLISGCMSSSIQNDVGRVRELTNVSELARVADADVDPAATEDARRLLGQPLDADAAVRIALLNNRELRATLRAMGIARGRVMQAGLLPNPTAEVEFLPERNTEIELRLEYDITDAVLAPLRARAAEPEIEAARYQAAGAVLDLGFRVRVAFYRLQSAEQRLGIAQQALDALAASRDAARALGEAGNLRALDLASQEAAYERARITVAELELEHATERERVHRLLGVHGAETEWRIRGRLAEAPERPTIPEHVETVALQKSLELIESKHRLEGLARRAGFTRRAGWIPDVSVDVHALTGNPEASAGADDDRDWRFGWGVSVGVPLFDRGQGNAASLEAEFDADMERYYGTAIGIRSAAREARNRLLSAHGRARQYADVILPAQERLLEQSLLQYNAMQTGVFQLLEVKREQLQAEFAYIDTLREYWSAVAELEALLAGRRVTSDAPSSRASIGMTANTREGH